MLGAPIRKARPRWAPAKSCVKTALRYDLAIVLAAKLPIVTIADQIGLDDFPPVKFGRENKLVAKLYRQRTHRLGWGRFEDHHDHIARLQGLAIDAFAVGVANPGSCRDMKYRAVFAYDVSGRCYPVDWTLIGSIGLFCRCRTHCRCCSKRDRQREEARTAFHSAPEKLWHSRYLRYGDILGRAGPQHNHSLNLRCLCIRGRAQLSDRKTAAHLPRARSQPARLR